MTCANCGLPLPEGSRSSRRYCSPAWRAQQRRELRRSSAEYIEALDPPTPARRTTAATTAADTTQPDLDTDALTVLTALATTSIPLTRPRCW
ncbi:hypothetical protein ACWDRB_49595 [Nonomuraea sp. NPDC003707]